MATFRKRVLHLTTIHLLVGAATVLTATPFAMADNSVATYFRDDPAGVVEAAGPLDPSGSIVIRREVVAPAAVVDRALALQPVRVDRIEVQLIGTTVTLDPWTDYTHQQPGSLDDNHFIPKAQALWWNQTLPSVRTFSAARIDGTVVIGPDDGQNQPNVTIYGSSPTPRDAAAGDIEPRMIIVKPDAVGPTRKAPKIPAVPRMPQPRSDGPKIALAD